MANRLVVLGLLALLVGACAIPQQTQRDGESAIGMPLPVLLNRIQRGEPVLDALPQPNKVIVEEQQNRHDSRQVDTIRTLVYPGLTLTVRDTGDKRLISQLVVMRPGYRTAEGLQVGSSLQDLSNTLGEADRLEGDEYVYVSQGPAPDLVRFRADDDRITRMQWDFYVD